MLIFSIQSDLCLKATILCLFVLSLKDMRKYLHMQLPLSLKSAPHKHHRRDGNWVHSQCDK